MSEGWGKGLAGTCTGIWLMALGFFCNSLNSTVSTCTHAIPITQSPSRISLSNNGLTCCLRYPKVLQRDRRSSRRRYRHQCWHQLQNLLRPSHLTTATLDGCCGHEQPLRYAGRGPEHASEGPWRGGAHAAGLLALRPREIQPRTRAFKFWASWSTKRH